MTSTLNYPTADEPFLLTPAPAIPRRRFPVLAAFLLVLGLAAGSAGGYLSRNGQVNDLTHRLSTSQAKVEDLKARVESLESDLSDAQNSLSNARSDLSASKAQVAACTDAVEADQVAIYWLLETASDAVNEDWIGAIGAVGHVQAGHVKRLQNACTGGSGTSI